MWGGPECPRMGSGFLCAVCSVSTLLPCWLNQNRMEIPGDELYKPIA